MYYFTSDNHFFHANIIKYCNRPFTSMEEMNLVMIRNWNEIVTPDDTVFHIGDFGLCKSSEAPNAPKDPFKFIRNQLNGNIIFIAGNHDCFSEKTRLLTIQGYKNYNEIKVGDLIPTLNLDTLTVEYQPIQKIIINPVERIYGFKTQTSEGEFSSNHKLLVSPCNQRFSPKALKKIECEKLWKRKSYFNVPSAIKSNITDYKIHTNWLKLLGWIYTDGGINKYCNSISIYQSKKENLPIIRNLLNSLNIKYKETIRHKKTIKILGKTIKSQLPAHIFYIPAPYGRKIKEKLQLINKTDVPNWLYYLSDKQMNILCHEMILGDGAINNTNNKVIWGNKDFLSKIQGLFVTHGIDCNLITTKRKDNYLCIHKNKHYIPTKEIQSKQCYIHNKSAITWCVTVKNHTLFTELNGKPLISGNSNNKNKSIIESMIIIHGGHRIFLTHNPKYYRKDFEWNFCGHTHGNEGRFRRIDKSIIVDVGVDCWDFRPIDINDIVQGYSKWRKQGFKNEKN